MAYSIRQVNHDGIKHLVCKIRNKVDGYILKKKPMVTTAKKNIYYYGVRTTMSRRNGSKLGVVSFWLLCMYWVVWVDVLNYVLLRSNFSCSLLPNYSALTVHRRHIKYCVLYMNLVLWTLILYNFEYSSSIIICTRFIREEAQATHCCWLAAQDWRISGRVNY